MDAHEHAETNDRHHAWRKYPLDEEIGAGAILLADASLTDVPRFREVWRRISLAGARAVPINVRHEVREITAEQGTVEVHTYSPTAHSDRARPAVLLLHGGAFVGGSVESVHGQCCDLASELGVVVVAVEYRLAPEHPYPAGLDDCVVALQWVADSATELGVDARRIAVHGTSAGGGLALALALRIRDQGGPRIRFLFLNSPEIDDRLATDSMRRFDDTPGFTSGDAAISWQHYLGEIEPGSDAVPMYAAPARSESYAGLPPTYLALMEFDPLRDEGLELARRLLRDDVRLEMHLFPGTFHGSSALHYAEVSRRESAEELAVLRRRLLGGQDMLTS